MWENLGSHTSTRTILPPALLECLKSSVAERVEEQKHPLTHTVATVKIESGDTLAVCVLSLGLLGRGVSLTKST